MTTLDKIPIRAPREWDATWFERFLFETLAPLLAQSSGADPTEVSDLVAASLVTATPEGDLPNSRALVGEPGVLETVDHGDSVEIRIEDYGIQLGKLQLIPSLSVLAGPIDADPTHVQALQATANDTVLRRVGDALDFGPVPDAALSANVALYDGDVATFSSGQFADVRISESSVTQHEAALSIGFSQLTGAPAIPGGLSEYADDAAAAVGGIAVAGLYRTGSAVKIRVS